MSVFLGGGGSKVTMLFVLYVLLTTNLRYICNILYVKLVMGVNFRQHFGMISCFFFVFFLKFCAFLQPPLRLTVCIQFSIVINERIKIRF